MSSILLLLYDFQVVGWVITRWESQYDLLTQGLESKHPSEKTWKGFVFDSNQKERIKAFVDSEDLISIGPLTGVATKFHADVKEHVFKMTNERMRSWFEAGDPDESRKEVKEEIKEGSAIQKCLAEVVASKLVLAVAICAKAAWFKIPKAKGDKEKVKGIVKATKAHIAKAELGKALFLISRHACV